MGVCSRPACQAAGSIVGVGVAEREREDQVFDNAYTHGLGLNQMDLEFPTLTWKKLSNMSQTFFTADLHFQHARILVYSSRPYSCVEEMDEAMIANWNAVVGPDDIVWVLGDYAMGDRARALGYLSRLRGRKMLISGNHDKTFASSSQSHTYIREYMDAGFEVVTPWTRIKLPPTRYDLPGRKVLLSHFPYDGDHTRKDRHAQARLRDEGDVLLHGHTHADEILSRSAAGSLQIHVGVDAHAYTPVSAEIVAQLIDGVLT